MRIITNTWIKTIMEENYKNKKIEDLDHQLKNEQINKNHQIK